MKVVLIQFPSRGRDCPPYPMAPLSAILRRAIKETIDKDNHRDNN